MSEIIQAMIVSIIIGLLFVILMIAASWRIFTKAGKPGWAALIPIYNTIVLLQIVGRPIWWIILLLIPFVNFIIAIILVVDLAKSFGHGAGFAMGLLFLGIIFWPLLAFGSSRYVGPAALAGAYPTPGYPPQPGYPAQPAYPPRA